MTQNDPTAKETTQEDQYQVFIALTSFLGSLENGQGLWTVDCNPSCYYINDENIKNLTFEFFSKIEKHTEYRVRMGPGTPGKSWNFIVAFSRTGKSWKKATGPGKFWKSVKLS